MRHKQLLMLVSLTILCSLLLSACDLISGAVDEQDTDAIVQTAVAQTQVAIAVEQTAIAVEPEIEQAPLPTPSPSDTTEAIPAVSLTPTETQTPTPDSAIVHVDQNTNCREGPGIPYDILGALLIGENSQVIGQLSGGDYWVIENPDGPGVCWVWGFYATLEGPTGGLPYFTPPPSPTPTFTATITLTPTITWTPTP